MSTAAPAFEVAGLSHTGLVRADNEDSWFADGDLGLVLVADGVGGHANGALASRTAVKSIADYIGHASAMLTESAMPARETQEHIVGRAIALANRRLIAQNAEVKDMRLRCGTTIVGVWAPRGADLAATLFHVGDSRAYRVRNGELRALTRDHSAYQLWLDSGKNGAPPPRSYILQALGLSDVAPDIVSIEPCRGDRILICSDGVSNCLAEEEIDRVLAANPGSDAACERLIELGLAHGGNDNLTAVVCAFR
jgi:protein phosphatase